MTKKNWFLRFRVFYLRYETLKRFYLATYKLDILRNMAQWSVWCVKQILYSFIVALFISFCWLEFSISSSSSSSSFFVIYWPIEMTFIFTVYVCIHSSYVYLANLHDVLNLFPFRFNPSSSLFICIELNRRVDSHLLTFFFFFFFSALDLRHKGHH